MITSDAIRCLIPSDAAIKGAELFCSTSNPVSSADSQTWASWIGVGVSALAAAVTFIAVLVAIRQAGDAKRIARDSNVQAIKRELMSRQWDRYEEFAKETIHMMQTLNKTPDEYALILTNQTHAGNAYSMYLSYNDLELSEAVIKYSDALQGIGKTLNEFRAAYVANEDFDKSVSLWIESRPNLARENMQNAAVLVNELRAFHQEASKPEEVTSDLLSSLELIIHVHKPLLTYYEREQPVFMRKYTS